MLKDAWIICVSAYVSNVPSSRRVTGSLLTGIEQFLLWSAPRPPSVFFSDWFMTRALTNI